MPKISISLEKITPAVSASIIVETKREGNWIRAENKVVNSDGKAIDLVVHAGQRILVEAIGDESEEIPVRPVNEPQATQPSEPTPKAKETVTTQPSATAPAPQATPPSPPPPAPTPPTPKP